MRSHAAQNFPERPTTFMRAAALVMFIAEIPIRLLSISA